MSTFFAYFEFRINTWWMWYRVVVNAILSTTTVNRFVNWKHHTNGEFTTGWVKPQPPFFPSEEHIESIFFFQQVLGIFNKRCNHIFVIEEFHLLIWELCIVSIWEKTGGWSFAQPVVVAEHVTTHAAWSKSLLLGMCMYLHLTSNWCLMISQHYGSSVLPSPGHNRFRITSGLTSQRDRCTFSYNSIIRGFVV